MRYNTAGIFSLLLMSVLLLAGCEQTMVNGPVGDAAVTVVDLRSGEVLTTGEFFTDTLEDAMTTYGEDFDTFAGLQQLSLVGTSNLNELEVAADRLYLVSMAGGFDYDASASGTAISAPTQVFGTVHALMTGAQMSAGGHVVGPLSEAAYQWLRPYLDVMTDAEVAAALDEYAEQLVVDVRLGDDDVNYDDLLTFNPLFHIGSFIGPQAVFDQMKAELGAAGSSDASKAVIAADLVQLKAPLNAGKAVFREVVSPEISQLRCITCHVAGGVAQTTRHLLVRTSNPDHINLNVTMYTNLVNILGVDAIVNKSQGMFGHGGGAQLQPGSGDVQNLDTFLSLL